VFPGMVRLGRGPLVCMGKVVLVYLNSNDVMRIMLKWSRRWLLSTEHRTPQNRSPTGSRKVA